MPLTKTVTLTVRVNMALIDVNVQRNVNVFFRNQRFDDVQDDGGGGEVADPERAELLRYAERFGRERDGTATQHQGHRSDIIRLLLYHPHTTFVGRYCFHL